jgi:hypothetical protein
MRTEPIETGTLAGGPAAAAMVKVAPAAISQPHHEGNTRARADATPNKM